MPTPPRRRRSGASGLLTLAVFPLVSAQFAAGQSLRVQELWRHSGPGIPWVAGGVVTGSTVVLLDGVTKDLVEVNWVAGTRRTLRLPGPGSPDFIGPASDGLAALSIEGRAIRVFSLEGEPREIRHFRVPAQVYFPKGLVVTPDGALLAAGMDGSVHGVHVLDPDGTIRARSVPNPNASTPLVARMLAGGVLTVSGSGEVLLSQADSHLLSRLDPRSGNIEVIASDTAIQPPVGDAFRRESADGRSRSRWHFPRGAGAARLPDGSLIHVIRFAEEGWSLWELYGPRGGLLGRVRLEGAYELWGLTADGRVVATVLKEGVESVPVLLKIDYGGG